MKKLMLAAAVVCLSISVAKADDADYAPQMNLSFGDLNLANPSGAKVALRRIKMAASEVCGGAPDTLLDLVAYGIYKSCYLDTVDEAVDRLHAPLVTSMYMSEPDHMRLAQVE